MNIVTIKYLVDLLVQVADQLKGNNANYFYGLRFEEWVVSWSHIQIENRWEIKKPDYWRLKDWRGDKSCYRKTYGGDDNTIIAKSSLAPDLTLIKSEKVSDKNTIWIPGDEIYVECKWTGKNRFELKKGNITSYIEYINNRLSESGKDDVEADDLLYYMFGIGWNTFKKRPHQAYIVQAKSLHSWIANKSECNNEKKSDQEYFDALPNKRTITKKDLDNWSLLTMSNSKNKEENNVPFTYKAIDENGDIKIYYRKVFNTNK